MKLLLLLVITYSSLIFGNEVIQQSCLGCHANTDVAPSFDVIQRGYKNNSSNNQELVSNYIKFLKDPSDENAILKDAVKKYGIMPKVNLSEQELKEVASYLANGNYSSISKNPSLRLPKNPMKKGKMIAKMTKMELGKNLIQRIKQEGTLGAVTFCNLNALSITNKKMKDLNAKIKRATDKPRNPSNLASSTELKYINLFKEQLKYKTVKPVIVKTQNIYHFYAPIITNRMCLQCHGRKGADINDKTYSKIKSLYPNDLAINYESNEIRGVFSISWEN